MAFPTAVNSQITDDVMETSQNGVDTLPKQILLASQAFTKTLEMENNVFQHQLDNGIKMVIDAMNSMVALCKEAVAIGNDNQAIANLQDLVANMKQEVPSPSASNAAAQATSMITPATATQPDNTTTDVNGFTNSLLHSVAISYQNAVNAQQQMNITLQAAFTMTVTTLFSTVTASLAASVHKQLEG